MAKPTKIDSRRDGRNPLSYLGVNAVAPSNTAVYDRAPTSSDWKSFTIGDRWIHGAIDPPDLWVFVKLLGTTATWINLSSHNTNGTDGQVLIGGGTEALWANITTASGLVIVNEGPNTLDLDLSGTIADIFQTDTLFAQPSGGVLEITGGASITTSGATNVVTIDVDTDVPTTFAADTGTAIAAANVITIAGGTSLTSSAAGSTVTLDVDTDVPTTFTTDAGGATPTDNEVKILGGLNITTEATGDAITINGLLATFFEPLASDPTDPIEGQVWYNTTTDLFKGSKGVGALAWVTKANFPYTYTAQNGASGTSIDSLCSGFTSIGVSVLYELSTDSWSNRSARNNPVTRGSLEGDSYLSALSFCGSPSPGCSPTTATEAYDGDGDSWTNKGALNQARRFNGGAGTTSDALAFGGRIDNNNCATNVQTSGAERYDGVGDAWTTKANLSATRAAPGGTGSGGDAICAGGLNSISTILNIVERYDGVGDAWGTKATLLSPLQFPSCCGPAGDALAIGGDTAPAVHTAATEEYDGPGDAWAWGPNLNIARSASGSSGSSTSDAITFEGASLTTPVPTERLESGPTIVTFTVT